MKKIIFFAVALIVLSMELIFSRVDASFYILTPPLDFTANVDWTVERANPQKSNTTAVVGCIPTKINWKLRLATSPTFAPITDGNGTLYFQSPQEVTACSADGLRLWTRTLSPYTAVYAPCVVTGNLIIGATVDPLKFGNNNGAVIILDHETPTSKIVRLESPLFSVPLPFGDGFVVGVSSVGIKTFDVHGNEQQTTAIVDAIFTGACCTDSENNLWYATSRGVVFCDSYVHVSREVVLWDPDGDVPSQIQDYESTIELVSSFEQRRFPTPRLVEGYGEVVSLLDGGILRQRNYYDIECLSSSGEVKWRKRMIDHQFPLVVLDDGSIRLLDPNGSLWAIYNSDAIELNRVEGAKLSDWPLYTSLIADAEGKLYSLRADIVTVFSREGEMLCEFKLPSAAISGPIISANGEVVLCDEQGTCLSLN